MSSSRRLRLLHRLPVIFIIPSIFPSVTCCISQFLREIWPIQLAFLPFTVRRIFLCSWLCNTGSFLTRSVQKIFSILLQNLFSKLFKVLPIYFPKCPTLITIQSFAPNSALHSNHYQYSKLDYRNLPYIIQNIPVAVRCKAWVWPLAYWECWFEYRHVHRCLFLRSAVCCQVAVCVSGWSLVQRSPTDCVLSGRGLCVGLITRTEESYRLCVLT